MLYLAVRRLNISVIFLFLSFFSVQILAQKITVINPSFEKPDTGKVKGFDGKCSDAAWTNLVDIPGWNVDSPDSAQFDSGVEENGPTDGTYTAFLMGGDSAIYQTLNRRVLEGDNIILTVDAKDIWLGTSFKMELFYVDEFSERIPIVTEVFTLTSTMEEYSISFKAADYPEALGYKIGILLDNVSEASSWSGLDNVRLINDNPQLIEIANYSFEEPDVQKIKGWDGVCADTTWKKNVDIPGWQSDLPAFDSGLETGWAPTDGIYVSFLKGADTSVYNITNYTIKENDEFLLTVDARDIWPDAEILLMEIFYVDDNNEKISMDNIENELTGEMSEYSLLVSANSNPTSVGHKIGVAFDNIFPSPDSWLLIDNVRLFNLTTTDVVQKTKTRPERFSLEQNYPNPFNPSTKISFSIKEAGFVKLNVYNLLGEHVSTLVNENLNVGTYEQTFDASNLPSGLYLYKLDAGNNVLVNKMMLLK